MDLEKEKWDKKKIDKAMEESEEEFLEITKRLYAAVTEFGVRALKTFQAAKSEPLNPLQINEIVTHELECVIETLRNPQTADLIIRMAQQEFFKSGEPSNKTA